jgi:hypothetical protein
MRVGASVWLLVYTRCGALAEELSGNKLRIGYHKVEGTPQSNDGLMMVYEVCSFEQIPQDIQTLVCVVNLYYWKYTFD